MNDINPAALATTVVWCGFGLGIALGFLMQKSRFCTMGAIADVVNFGDWSRARMWMAAVAVALLGVTAMTAAGWIAPAKSLYGGDRVLWLSACVGGLLFGFGMVLAGGCSSKALLRMGHGSLKGLVVFIVLGLVAAMTLKGVLGVLRVATLEKVAIPVSSQSLLVGEAGVWVGLGAGLLLAAMALFTRQGRALGSLLAGAGVGGLIVLAWFITGKLGYIAEDPNTLQEAFVATNSGKMEALSFVAPFAYIQDLLVLWSDKSKAVSWGIAAAVGVFVGALAQALFSGGFRWEGFADTEDLANHLAGAAMMGFGGVVAGGCTFGQGISGLSMASMGAVLATLGIVGGAWLALIYQTKRLERLM
jgi:uncharacterized membrane protein YedE/YeeE